MLQDDSRIQGMGSQGRIGLQSLSFDWARAPNRFIIAAQVSSRSLAISIHTDDTHPGPFQHAAD